MNAQAPYHHANSCDEDDAPLPLKLQKISARMSELATRIGDHKKEASNLYAEFTAVRKMFDKYTTKIAKAQTKASAEQKKRKPSGFARPTSVSSELCLFMGRPEGDLISRTETSRYLSKYISDHGLFHPQKKNVILPDESLAQLLGDEAKDAEITYFTIQKYINRHFVQKHEGEEEPLELSQGL
jgi:upstream activation factor subunit UAF30